MAEAQVAHRRAPGVELVGPLKGGLITVARTQHQKHQLALRDLLATNPPHARSCARNWKGVEAQCFFDDGIDLRRLLANSRQHFRVQKQQVQRIANEVGRGLKASNKQQTTSADDLFVRQTLSIDPAPPSR